MPLIDVGADAPAFSLVDQSGRRHSLDDYAGRPLVLYFYPKDDTSGCTAQACGFRDGMPAFSGVGAAVVGLSPDDAGSHAKFAKKFALKFPLLADVAPAGANEPPVCAAYGVWGEKSMYGRKYMGVVRTTYLIDGDGRVVRRWDSVKVPGHAEEVLGAVRRLTGVEHKVGKGGAGMSKPKRAGTAGTTEIKKVTKKAPRGKVATKRATRRPLAASKKKTRRR